MLCFSSCFWSSDLFFCCLFRVLFQCRWTPQLRAPNEPLETCATCGQPRPDVWLLVQGIEDCSYKRDCPYFPLNANAFTWAEWCLFTFFCSLHITAAWSSPLLFIEEGVKSNLSPVFIDCSSYLPTFFPDRSVMCYARCYNRCNSSVYIGCFFFKFCCMTQDFHMNNVCISVFLFLKLDHESCN